MASFFTLTLDTTGPQDATFRIAAGATYITSLTTTGDFSTSDPDTTGYQIKIWGADVDTTFDPDIQDTEGRSAWKTYSRSVAVKVLSGDGTKTLKAKIRDDVWNETSELSDTVTLDTTVPVVTVSAGPTPTKISKVTGKDESDFSFQVDTDFVEYKVKVVPATGSIHSAGTLIPMTGGSVNMSGTGTFRARTNIDCTIDGADLEAADSGDGDKIVKVFAKDDAGNWSVA